MKPIQCPSCQLKWNIREDSPRVVTCPLCLGQVNNPEPPLAAIAMTPPPLPVRGLDPLEHEVSADSSTSGAGLWAILALMVAGVVIAMLTGPQRPLHVSVSILLATTVAVTILMFIMGIRTGKSYATGISAGVVVSGCLCGVLVVLGLLGLLFSACGGMYKGL